MKRIQREAQILLIGGELLEYRRLRELLTCVELASYQLSWCESFEQALETIATASADAILLDCQHQPELALSLLAEIIAQGCKSPVIALTQQKESAVSQQALKLGATDYLAGENSNSYILERCLGYAIEKHKANEKSTQLNLYDALTGIPNRILFRQTMERSLELAKQQQISLALLLINLDGFKKVNQSYGSAIGDNLVITMAKRLSHCVRKSDAIARVGADEFTIMLEGCYDHDDVVLVTQKVIDALSAPFEVQGGLPLMVSCSIGVAVFPQAGDSVDGLLKRANMAMLEAKTQRGSVYRFYNEATCTEASERLNLEADLRRALRANQFELYYQPRVDLATGATVGMEALIRWHHPSRGMVSPQEFIPVAEECGLIMPIGYWVIQQACADMRMFDIKGHDNLEVAINLSFKQLQDTMFVDTVTRIIEQSGVDASRLEFELTETAIMSNYQQTYESMIALSKLGLTFSLDDFGTGFSSFAHIQRLPISALKVDRSFVRNVVSNKDDAIIVKAMINLANSLGLKVIAEGVETLDQAQFLWQNQCNQVQGFYYSPAVTAQDFIQRLTHRVSAVS